MAIKLMTLVSRKSFFIPSMLEAARRPHYGGIAPGVINQTLAKASMGFRLGRLHLGERFDDRFLHARIKKVPQMPALGEHG